MSRKPAIDELLNTTPQLWRGRRSDRSQRTLPTGHPRLDSRLPGKGWPLGAVTELLCARPGLGEFSLLFPALADLGAQGQWVVLVDPPCIPYPAALQAHGLQLERLLLIRTHDDRESQWACEQALRSGRGGAVLAWPQRIGFTHVRRLQLAAETHAKLAVLFRPASALREPSPAPLRLQLQPGDRQGTCIDILKCRGSRPSGPAWMPRPFSTHAKPQDHNQAHALARHPLTAPGPGPVHTGSGQPGSTDRAERHH